MVALLELNRKGNSILIVTHDSKVAGKCDRILYRIDGVIGGEMVNRKRRGVGFPSL